MRGTSACWPLRGNVPTRVLTASRLRPFSRCGLLRWQARLPERPVLLTGMSQSFSEPSREDRDEALPPSSPSIENEGDFCSLFLLPSGGQRGGRRRVHGPRASPSLSKTSRRHRLLHPGEKDKETLLRRSELLRARQEAEQRGRRRKLMEELGLVDSLKEDEEWRDTLRECTVFGTREADPELELRIGHETVEQQEKSGRAEEVGERAGQGDPGRGSRQGDGGRTRGGHSFPIGGGRPEACIHSSSNNILNMGRRLSPVPQEDEGAHSTPARTGFLSRRSFLSSPASVTSPASLSSPLDCPQPRLCSEGTGTSFLDQEKDTTDTTTSAPPHLSADPECFACSPSSANCASASTSAVSLSCTAGALCSAPPLSLPYPPRAANSSRAPSPRAADDPSPPTSSSSRMPHRQSFTALSPCHFCSDSPPPVSSSACAAAADDPSLYFLSHSRTFSEKTSNKEASGSHSLLSRTKSTASGDGAGRSGGKSDEENTTASPSALSSTDRDAFVPPSSLSASPLLQLEEKGAVQTSLASPVSRPEQGKASDSPVSCSWWRERVTGAVWTAASCFLPLGSRWQGKKEQGGADETKGGRSSPIRRSREPEIGQQMESQEPVPDEAAAAEGDASPPQSSEHVCLGEAVSHSDGLDAQRLSPACPVGLPANNTQDNVSCLLAACQVGARDGRTFFPDARAAAPGPSCAASLDSGSLRAPEGRIPNSDFFRGGELVRCPCSTSAAPSNLPAIGAVADSGERLPVLALGGDVTQSDTCKHTGDANGLHLLPCLRDQLREKGDGPRRLCSSDSEDTSVSTRKAGRRPLRGRARGTRDDAMVPAEAGGQLNGAAHQGGCRDAGGRGGTPRAKRACRKRKERPPLASVNGRTT